MLITPTGMAYDAIRPRDIVFVDAKGDVPGKKSRKPSSEWRFHLAAYHARPDMNAVVHTHSLHATVLACAQQADPGVPLHGRGRRRQATSRWCPTTRSAPRSWRATSPRAWPKRNACLMANHGQIALGATLARRARARARGRGAGGAVLSRCWRSAASRTSSAGRGDGARARALQEPTASARRTEHAQSFGSSCSVVLQVRRHCCLVMCVRRLPDRHAVGHALLGASARRDAAGRDAVGALSVALSRRRRLLDRRGRRRQQKGAPATARLRDLACWAWIPQPQGQL